MASTWGDDSDESQEDADDHTNNYVAFTVRNEFSDKNLFFTNNVVTESIATASATTSGGIVDDTDFKDETEDDSDNDDLSLGKIQEAYKKMYSKWLVVCKRNKSLEDEVGVLTKERDELKKAATNYEILATKHQGKLAETRLELEQTQKNLRMLNSSTSKLDHLLSQQKICGDHSGLGYKGQEFSGKTVFMKGATSTMMQSFKKSRVRSDKKVVAKPVVTRQATDRFVPTCHYCNLPGHIRPRCYKYLNALKRGMIINSPNFAFTRRTPKMKVDVQYKFPRRVWVRKCDLRCHEAYNSFRACTTNSEYCGNGHFKSLIGDKSIMHRRIPYSGGV